MIHRNPPQTILDQPKLDAGEPGTWTFEKPEIAADFDRHVREQLPWYDLATGVVAHVARHIIPRNGLVVDVGASTGNIGRAIAPILAERGAGLIALETSPAMMRLYDGPGKLVACDARDFKWEEHEIDMAICFLVLMFVPIVDREDLILRMIHNLKVGGALVVFDKLEPGGGDVGMISSRLTLAAKYEAGAPPDEIIRKELSLAGVQRPLRAGEVERLSPIFRFGDFGGWLFTK